jgi:hypothetical protein
VVVRVSLEATDTRARNKVAGERAEQNVAGAVSPLELVPDDVAEHVDAVATATIDPTEQLPMVGLCLLERGTLVEIKSVVVRYDGGSRGRFYFRPEQHAALLEECGVYLFAVCEANPDRELLTLKVVPATVVDDALLSWIDGGDGRSDFAQLAWSRIFAPQEVSKT